MRVSVVVPVHDNAAGLAECLRALASSGGSEVEVIVVDDASTDDSGAVASRFGARVLRLDPNSGAGAARNHGARSASGEILLFVDSDVVVEPDTIGRVVRFFEERPDVAAVFGSYDKAPGAPGLVSQFRNLLHHFVHQQGDPEASTFWAGCGAIRRPAFESVGGFDTGTYGRSIEDIELGYRLRDAGYRIALDKGLSVKHLKRWTLGSFLRTDIYLRAIPWSRLILERRVSLDHLNLKLEQRASVALALIAAAALPIALVLPAMLAVAGVAVVALALANLPVLAFFARERGIGFAGAAVPLLFLHYLASGLGYLWVRTGRAFARVS